MGATIINTIIGLVIGALFTALVNRIKLDMKKEKEQTSDIALLKQGLCSMQRNTLLKECEFYLSKKACPDDTKKVLYEMYKSKIQELEFNILEIYNSIQYNFSK